MELIQVSMTKEAFLGLLDREIEEYTYNNQTSQDRKKLFLAMNEHFCDEGIGGTGNCESIEDYVNAFVYGASWGYIEDIEGYGDEYSKKVDWCYDNCLYTDEDLKMYVESF